MADEGFGLGHTSGHGLHDLATSDDMALRAGTNLIPTSTYRLQLNSRFAVQDAIEIIPYLNSLGIGALYVSPILAARSGSAHGYDVVDHNMLNPELGSSDDFRNLGQALMKVGMGMVVDIVPNHMCISDPRNWRWMDVLENGPSSPHAVFFDIDWRPPRSDLADKVLIPVLGDQYGRVLENGELLIEYSDGAFFLRFHDHVFPVAPRTWRMILESVKNGLRSHVGSPFITELESILTALSYLPLRSETAEDRIRERQREKEVIKTRLAHLLRDNDALRQAVETQLKTINGERGDAASFNDLERLLGEQAYRLSYWRVAADEINYRRFFDVNELAAIRVEDSVVFEAVHKRIFEGIREGWITGLRIDHPDGLYDPVRYFARLRRAVSRLFNEGEPAVPCAELYVVAEKIMAHDEAPRPEWQIHGTTGYGFLNEANALFVKPQSRDDFHRIYERFTGRITSVPDLMYECKRLILTTSMSSELNVLARRLDRICQQHRHSRDFTLESLRFALQEIIACFSVYRTYVSENQTEVSAEDRGRILRAPRKQKSAIRRSPVRSLISSLRFCC
jgi:(1->4)-alpha-D-glucan 1-alpha-D-glucosylmutase